MPNENYTNIEIEEVADYVVREAERLKKVCNLYALKTISAHLEMNVTEAKRLSGEPDPHAITCGTHVAVRH